MSWYKDWKPEILCIGAGGMKGMDELGALWWFWSENVLSNVDSYIGCSIGGIICALLSIGYWPHEILTYAIDTTLFKNAEDIQMTGVTREYGLVSNSTFDDALAKRLKQMIIDKMGRIPTLEDLYKITGKTLYLTIASLKERKVFYASHKTHPNMDLFVALRATSNMPGVFGKLEHQKDYFVDGAVMDPLPALHLDDGKTPMLVIGVMDDCPWVFEKVNAMGYFDRILAMSLKALTENTIANCSKACYCLIIPVSDEIGLIESSSREARMSKFLSGYNYTTQYVKTNPHRPPSIVSQTLPPLSKEMIMSCLKSNAGKNLMRCLSENPSLFQECTGLNSKVFQDSTPVEISKSNSEVPQDSTPSQLPRMTRPVRAFKESVDHPMLKPQTSQPIIPVVGEIDDDDIIEIPRMERPPVFPMFRQPAFDGFNIEIRIPRELGNALFGMFLMSMKTLGPASGNNFGLP